MSVIQQLLSGLEGESDGIEVTRQGLRDWKNDPITRKLFISLNIGKLKAMQNQTEVVDYESLDVATMDMVRYQSHCELIDQVLNWNPVEDGDE